MIEITKPVDGAGELTTTEPDTDFPPMTLEGDTVKETKFGALIVRFPVAVLPAALAEMVAVSVVPTATVRMVNVPERRFAEIKTDVGTVAAETLLVSLTIMPPVGAGPLRLIVPVALVPPTKEPGVIDTDNTDGGLMVKFADPLVEPSLAVIATTF